MRNERTRLHDNLRHYLARLERRIEAREALTRRLGTIRLGLVIAGAAIVYVAYQTIGDVVGGLLLVLFAGAFILTGIRQGRIDRSLDRHRRWLALKRTHLARLHLDWEQLPPSAIPVADFAHPFEADLNLTGERSLLRLIDTTITSGGRKRLLDWLRNPTGDRDEILRRQRLVRALRGAVLFRDRLTLEVELTPKAADAKGEADLLQMVQHQVPGTGRALAVVSVLAVCNWVAVALDLLNVVDALWAISLPVYAVVYVGQYRRLVGLFERAEELYFALLRFGAIFRRIERYRFAEVELRRLCSAIQDAEDKPSRLVRRSARIAAGAGTQKSEILTLALNLLGPWDIFFAHRLEKVKDRLRTRLPAWLEAWHELEALNALATMAWLHPEAPFPEPGDESQPLLSGRGLGHPLITDEQKVRNDFELRGEGEICLITGSNMSGKSTFLRTLGVNLVLAGMGAPVDAETFRWRPVRLFSCLQVSDSVNDGISYFYAEVKRLRALLEEARSDHPLPLIFLIDEIFRGTNNRERLIGSRSYIETLAGERAAGLIATHDLELVALEQEIPGIRNLHFREEVEEGRMVFDYRLRSGPSPTTNALLIMKTEGLPVSG